jgi:hypothetical protein
MFLFVCFSSKNEEHFPGFGAYLHSLISERMLLELLLRVTGGKASGRQPQDRKLNYSQKYFKDVPPDLLCHDQVKR